MNRIYYEQGIASMITYIIIISVIAMLSLIIILSFMMNMPIHSNATKVEFLQNGTEIHHIVCSEIDDRGYAYYNTSKNPVFLDVYLEKNNKPLTAVWITMSGCGITTKTTQTNSYGIAQFSLAGVNLPPGINQSNLTFMISGYKYDLQVIRG